MSPGERCGWLVIIIKERSGFGRDESSRVIAMTGRRDRNLRVVETRSDS